MGIGDPVVVLHGLAESHRTVGPLVDALTPDHKVYAPDLPGHGTRPALPGAFRFRDLVGWFVALLDELGAGQAHVVGHSLGGRLALEVALQHPERVRSVVALAPPLTIGTQRSWVPIARLVDPRLGGFVPVPLLARTRIGSVLKDALTRSELGRPDSVARPEWERAVLGEIVGWLHRRDARITYLAALRRIYLGDPERFWKRLATLEPPSLFVWGEHDHVSAASQAAVVTRVVPAATTLVIPDCGHSSLYERPDLVLDAVASFLAQGTAA